MLIGDGDGVGGGIGRKSEGSTADTAQKRPERSWTAARTMVQKPFVRLFCFCLMSSDAKSILGTIYKLSLSLIYHCRNRAGTVFYIAAHRPVTGRQRPTGEKGWGNSGPVTRASLHSSPATVQILLAK